MKGARPLTSGEIELARSMFGDAIDYGRVKLARRKWWPFQPKGIVMAPTGNIHFHPDSPLSQGGPPARKRDEFRFLRSSGPEPTYGE